MGTNFDGSLTSRLSIEISDPSKLLPLLKWTVELKSFNFARLVHVALPYYTAQTPSLKLILRFLQIISRFVLNTSWIQIKSP